MRGDGAAGSEAVDRPFGQLHLGGAGHLLHRLLDDLLQALRIDGDAGVDDQLHRARGGPRGLQRVLDLATAADDVGDRLQPIGRRGAFQMRDLGFL